MKKLYNQKIVSLFIILQPFIDALTYFSNLKLGFSIGLVLRGLFLFYAIVYLIFVDKSKKINLIFPIAILLYLLLYYFMNCHDFNIFVYKIPSLFKFLYFPILILFMYRFYDKKLKNKMLFVVASICFIMIIAQLSGHVVISYENGKLGNSGWFFSTNEFSSICSILFPLVLSYCVEKLNKFGFILLTIFTFCMLLIGTKSSYLAIALSLVCMFLFIIYKIVFEKENCKNQLFSIIIMLILFALVTPFTFTYRNIYIQNAKNIDDFVLSGRDDILENNIENIKTTSNSFNMFTGIYLNQKYNYEFERDFYNIYFNYGIIGLLLYFSVPVYLIFSKLIIYIKERKKLNFTKISALIGLLISMGLAYISGHTLLSPSVSLYITIITLILIYNKHDEEKKKVIFISSLGGHLTQLMEFKKIFSDYDYLIVTEKSDVTKPLKENYNIEFLKYGSRRYLFKYIFIFLFNIIKSIYIFGRYTPDVIVTTGTHTAVPMCYIGWLFDKKIIYIESFAKRKSGTLSGRLVYPIATKFVVQWESMLDVYPKAEYWGGIY